MFVNALFALIAFRLRTKLLATVVALGAVALTWTAAFYGNLEGGASWDDFPAGFSRVIFSFFAGVGLYQAWRAGWAPRLKLGVVPAVILMLAVFAAPVYGHKREVFDLLAVLVVFPALTLAAARSTPGPSWVSLCATLGALSYAVYIIHAPIIRALGAITEELFSTPLIALGEVGSAIVIVLSIAAALTADRRLDLPIRRWLSRRLLSAPRAAVGRPL